MAQIAIDEAILEGLLETLEHTIAWLGRLADGLDRLGNVDVSAAVRREALADLAADIRRRRAVLGAVKTPC